MRDRIISWLIDFAFSKVKVLEDLADYLWLHIEDSDWLEEFCDDRGIDYYQLYKVRKNNSPIVALLFLGSSLLK
jgi:hypothetical protein